MKDITLRVDGQFSAISDETVTAITNLLNGEIADEPKIYSEIQVKRALWGFLEDEIDNLREELDIRFLNALPKMSSIKQDRLLGEPELDRATEDAFAKADTTPPDYS